MTSVRREQIVSSLQDKEYRDLFVAEEIDTGLPLQIRVLRTDRGWSQRELAERVGMTQEGICRLENLDYGRYTLTTLKRLASAFDVALVIRFEPFSRLVDWAVNLAPEDMRVPDFEHDSGVIPAETSYTVAQTVQNAAGVKRVDMPASVVAAPGKSTDIAVWRRGSTDYAFAAD